MSLNKTNGNMYPWVTHTWNPLAGYCHHDCEYCYMRDGFLGKLSKYKGEVELDEDEINTKLGNGKTIFVCSAIDLFGEWVSNRDIRSILDRCKDYSNTYLFQSKNPSKIGEFLDFMPEDSIVGTTIESNRNYSISKAPKTEDRHRELSKLDWPNKMISIEPILDFDLNELGRWIRNIEPEFVSIGADSKDNDLEEPNGEKIEKLINRIERFTEVKTKKNLERLLEKEN